MKAYVISLVASTERRQFQQAQLSALGVPFEIVDAVSTQDLSTLPIQVATDGWERPLMPTEVACFHSHFQLWQKIVADQKPALILEDDAILSQQLSTFLALAQDLQGVDHLSLETRLRKKRIGPVRQLNTELGVAPLYQDRTGAAAYILWPSGAHLLCQQAQQGGAALADALISNLYRLHSWQAVPALAVQSDVAADYAIASPLQTHSYIQANDNKANHRAHGLQSVRFKIRRITAQLKQALRYVTTMPFAQRLFVEVHAQGFEKTAAHPNGVRPPAPLS